MAASLSSNDGAAVRFVESVLLHEGDGLRNGNHRITLQFPLVDNPTPGRPLEAPHLDPGVRKMAVALAAEEQHPAHRGHFVSLVPSHQA